MTSTPSRVSRRPASRSSRARTSWESDGEWRTSKRNCTAVASLLTFCPPGPDERMKLSDISLSSIAMWSLMRSMIQMSGVGRQITEKTDHHLVLYQPSNCLIDDCPIARCDGGDSSGLVDELLPSFLAGIKNVGVGLEHAVGEIGLAQVLPDVLSRVEFRTCRRQ